MMPSPDQMLIAWQVACVALVAGILACVALALWQAGVRLPQRRRPRARRLHGRTVRSARRFNYSPTEVRRHDGTGETYPGSARGAQARADVAAEFNRAQPTRHALVADDPVQRRWRVANLLDDTSADFTSDDLAAVLGPRPDDLIGAAA